MAKGSTIRGGKLLAATTLMLGMPTTASYAYTPQQEQLCTGDAMRLCGEYIPDVDRITACMVSKHDQLSEGCNSRCRRLPQLRPRRPTLLRQNLQSRSTSRPT
jgi:hypothetical protein